MRARLHPTTMRKVPAPAQLAYPTLPHCMLGQDPMHPIPASPWSCRNISSPWALEANFQGPVSVPSFLQLAGVGIEAGELEGWEVLYPDRGRLGCRAKMRVDGWCERGAACLCWKLAWLETGMINSAKLHARREEREEHQGC